MPSPFMVLNVARTNNGTRPTTGFPSPEGFVWVPVAKVGAVVGDQVITEMLPELDQVGYVMIQTTILLQYLLLPLVATTA